MANETEGRSGTPASNLGGLEVGSLSDLDEQFPSLMRFVKIELSLLLLTVVLAVVGTGWLFLPGLELAYEGGHRLTMGMMYWVAVTMIGMKLLFWLFDLDVFAEVDTQYPVATWFVKAELLLLYFALNLSIFGKGMLFWGGSNIWMYHDLYLMAWVTMYTLGATGVGTGLIYLLWKFFAK